MIERFQGPDGRRRLIEALLLQEVTRGTQALAEVLADRAALEEVAPGHAIIEQGAADLDLYFIVTGSFQVLVFGREVALRHANQHVGEMSLINPQLRRSASVVAAETSVVAKLTEAQFVEIAKDYHEVWRWLAGLLTERLHQRNALIRPMHGRSQVFIGSTVEDLPVAQEIQLQLQHAPFDTIPWNAEIFSASTVSIEALERAATDFDFAVLVLAPNDRIAVRGEIQDAPRDNLVFELGLFMGALGRDRTFIVMPMGVDLKLPTDLLGITPLQYSTAPASLSAQLGPVCTLLSRAIITKGSR